MTAILLDEDGPKPYLMLLHRALIARTVADDPETFTEAFLERPNAEYCAWILDEQKWGGAIELSILSKCAP